MTVLLFLFTIVVFLAADHVVQRARARKVTEAVRERVASLAGSLKQIPSGVELALNHMWMKREQGSIITIGVDEFISRFFGTVGTIVLPAIGEAAENIVLKDGERSIPLLCPVDGRVVAVNQNVAHNPSVAHTDPYGNGWLFQVELPSRQQRWAPRVPAASEWLGQQIAAAREFFLGHAGAQNYALMQDGGALVDGVLKMYDNAVWAEFGRKFLALPVESAPVEQVASR